MTQLFATIAIVLLSAVSLFQAAYVLLYSRRADRWDDTVPQFTPKVAIILCLRGRDPELEKCLTQLSCLEYPNFEIHLVFDNAADPSWEAVEQFKKSLALTASLKTHVIDPINAYGSLKCQAIARAIDHLESCEEVAEVIALVDADAIVESDWLMRLVQPLRSPAVGATTGNRWFSPSNSETGSWVRAIWNAAAVVQMEIYNIAWGGSLAIKTSTVREAKLVDKWKSAFCEDSMLSSVLNRHQLELVRIPEVTINNQESLNLSGTFRWVTRQLLTVRLYHRLWPFVLAHAVSVGLCSVGTLLVIICCAVSGKMQLAIALGVTWLAFQIINGLLIDWIGKINRQQINNKSGLVKHPSFLGYALALFIAQIIQPMAALKAAFARNVEWREVEYEIQSDATVKMTKYQPFSRSHQPNESI